ncbi:uroporphyrinogen-III C-methyltransferase [Brachybacterium sacelli]|uniref:uroporphyrinogen-III C-methyltransferase n=1 Tax=Brachybacterium sacelli TaxID=173364 RepID=A0ABS4X605_9MICO|nr:uroporphyrinogen-III C-methyltransferase [Brachybacterium sacelli]MBP2383899.1 uroporphyrin-III C-methyltransferase [Brachybacterium sacelli]
MTPTLADLVDGLGGAVLPAGSVALIGGGPGALDLITVRGLALLGQADVVVVDRLGPRGLTELLGNGIEVIDVGKQPGRHAVDQEGIESLLVDRARAGHRVARLKGGDPFLLGRGGEEILACRAADVPVQVVPGVTSAIAGPGAGDVPVTHRGTAVALHVVNAHGDLGPADLAALRDPGTTTVLMMGVGWLPRLVAQALLNGVDPATPVAVVQNASLPEQRTVHGRLGTIDQVAAEAGVGFPAVITVGRTAAEGFLHPPEPVGSPRGAGREALPRPSAAADDDSAVEPTSTPHPPVLVGCAHGTRSRAGRDTVRALLRRIAREIPDVPVREAYLDVQTPEVAAVVAEQAEVRAAVRTREDDAPAAAVVVPLLLSTGVHVDRDISAAVADREAVAAAPLGPDPRLALVLAQRLAEAGASDGDAVVLAAAGTRDPAGQAMAHEMGRLLTETLGREVIVGFLAAAEPSLPEAVSCARERTGSRVALATYLLAPGFFHDQLAPAGADLVAAPLGDHPLVAEVAVERYRQVLGS